MQPDTQSLLTHNPVIDPQFEGAIRLMTHVVEEVCAYEHGKPVLLFIVDYVFRSDPKTVLAEWILKPAETLLFTNEDVRRFIEMIELRFFSLSKANAQFHENLIWSLAYGLNGTSESMDPDQYPRDYLLRWPTRDEIITALMKNRYLLVYAMLLVTPSSAFVGLGAKKS